MFINFIKFYEVGQKVCSYDGMEKNKWNFWPTQNFMRCLLLWEKYIHHYKFKVKSKIFDIWEIMLLGWERDMHSESQTNGGLQIILLRNGERVIAGNSSQVGTVLERSWVRMDWSDLMTGWLLWESVGVKERKESGRNLRFSFCAALATRSRDISSGWEHSQKNKYRLEVGRKAWASFGFGG